MRYKRYFMSFNNQFVSRKENEGKAAATAKLDLAVELEAKASKMHTLISIGAVLVLVLYIPVDKHYLSEGLFLQSVVLRCAVALVALSALLLHVKRMINSTVLVYFSVLLPMVCYNYLCSQVPLDFLWLSNLYYVFVLVFCSLLLCLHYVHSIVFALVALASYFSFFAFLSNHLWRDLFLAGGMFLVLSFIFFPTINYFHNKSIMKKITTDFNLLKLNEQINNHKIEILRQNAQLREMNQMKDRFFSIISHDLRSPFQNILGFMELATRNMQNEEKAERFLHLASQSTTYTYQLLEDLLEWTRLQSDSTTYQPERVLLRRLVEDGFKVVQGIADYKKIQLKCDVDDAVVVYVSRDLLKTVFRNLVTNAIKFTNEGGEVIVSTSVVDGYRQFDVTDTGVGIELDKMLKMFESAQGFTSLGTKSEKGSGLGLMLCKDILEKIGGRIWVESELGQGSVFKFRVPLTPGASDEIFSN